MATAYADHLANYPGLKRWLDEKPKPDIAPIDIEQFIDHNSSPEQLSFNEAVWREDWRWLARSNDPRSVPLLRKYIANHLDLDSPARSSIHSIEKSFLANLMESRQPEIQATVREIMSGADWTSQDLLHYYIDRQIEAGVSREELTAWYGQLDFGSMSDHCLPLLIKCGGKNMADYLPPVSDWRPLHGGFPKPVVRWIANEWTENRSVDLYRIISRRPVPETVRDALSKTDLGTTEKAREFIEMMYRTAAPSGVVRDALAEATSTAFRQASDQDHISALAEAFELLPTETALSALEDYDGPKNEKVDQYLQNVKAAIKANKALNKHQIQQARDLIAGKTGPEDLIATRRFQWVNDRYVEVTNP